MTSEFYPSSRFGYAPKIPFWTRQQLESFERSLHLPLYALWMEPRTGKSKPCVDTACYHFERPDSPLHVTGVLVVAWPNGVHRGWISDAFPENTPDRVRWHGFVWDAPKARQAARTKTFSSYEDAFKKLLDFKGLAVFAVNTESLIGDDCKKYIARFLKARGRVMAIGDESSSFADPNSRRAKTMMSIAKRPEVVIKRALDGTPADAAGPLDFYSQVKFLSPAVLGFGTFSEYKAHYAQMEEQGDWQWRDAKKKAYLRLVGEGKDERLADALATTEASRFFGKGHHWPGIAKDAEDKPIFRNMDEFWRRMDKVSYRATFAQCFPDAAKPVFAKRRFELTPEQRKVYDSLRDEFRAEVAGNEITAAHQLTRLLRLQQVASNYFPRAKTAELHGACEGNGCDDCEDGIVYFDAPPVEIDPGRNPRQAALREETKDGRPTIVWCRFRHDAEECFALGQGLGFDPVRYDGTVTNDQKISAKDAFQAGRAGWFVANAQSAGRGIPLWRGERHVFYSNTFSYRTRKQAEDRTEHGSKKFATLIVDLVANDTVDDQVIIPALRGHMDVATFVMRDAKREWI